MVDNVQKLPLGRTLQEHGRRKVLEHLQLMSGRAPATLMKAQDKTNTIWMVKFDTDSTYTLPQITMPVHGSEYQRVPYQEGAKGHVQASDFETGNMTGLRAAKGPVDFTRPGNLSSLTWHPLGNTDFKHVIDPDAHETYGAKGGTITHDGTAKSLVKTHSDKGTSVSSGGDGSGAPGPHEMATDPQKGTSIKTPMPHTLQAKNATLNEQGDQTNEGKHTAKGDITSATGNVEAPAGSMMAGVSMSAPSGSFASGAIGGLKLLGGILSGGGGSSGSPSLMIAPEEVSAATVRTNVAYTVAQLNQALPPGPGMVGLRAYVTDAQASPMFLATLVGGGTQGCPAVCLYGAPAGSTDPNNMGYFWAAG